MPNPTSSTARSGLSAIATRAADRHGAMSSGVDHDESSKRATRAPAAIRVRRQLPRARPSRRKTRDPRGHRYRAMERLRGRAARGLRSAAAPSRLTTGPRESEPTGMPTPGFTITLPPTAGIEIRRASTRDLVTRRMSALTAPENVDRQEAGCSFLRSRSGFSPRSAVDVALELAMNARTSSAPYRSPCCAAR